jgi:UDP-N-acetylmuramate: L-alanyl-gamma-D-glutamyl-meso-diaminopimelate ligase
MKLHILGIAGTFMGGVAALARELGHAVEGSDQAIYPPMSTQLEALGIPFSQGYLPENISRDCDEVVVGNALSRGNAAVEAVLDEGRKYTSGAQWLAENVLPGRDTIAVAGTHGKTTTTTILSYLLHAAGRDPGFLIGGVAEDFGVSARVGSGREFVVEADEYDTAFFDKRSKFVHYRPRTVILNNLEFDHADIFPDLGAIETQFHHLVRTIPRSGLIVANAGEAALKRVLARGCWSALEWFGDAAGWHAQAQDEHRFTIGFGGSDLGAVQWALSGDYNRNNALAAIAAARHAGVPPSVAIEALARFANVRRRMEVRGSVNGITVYDDFAHHPTAIRLTIDALRERAGNARIIAVLEPRSNTMKLGMMKDALGPSLARADRIFCYSNGIGWDVAAALAPLGAKAVVSGNLDALVEAIADAARPGDQVLIMSNGGFGGIHDKLLGRLGAQNP